MIVSFNIPINITKNNLLNVDLHQPIELVDFHCPMTPSDENSSENEINQDLIVIEPQDQIEIVKQTPNKDLICASLLHDIFEEDILIQQNRNL